MSSFFAYVIRLVSRFVMRPINMGLRRISKALNFKLAIQMMITSANRFFRGIIKGRPAKLEDYYPWQRWLISKKLLYIWLIVLIALPIIYVHFIDPLVKGWLYIPGFTINEPNMSVYSGKAAVRYEQGQRLYEGEMSQGRFTGKGKLYTQAGDLRYEGGFLLDEYDGDGELWSDDGRLVYRGTLKQGEFDGSGKYSQNGVLIYDGEYKKGMYDGFGRLYDASGTMIYEGDFKAGAYQGKGTLLLNGKKIYQGNFADGQYDGYGATYDENENVIYKGNFVAGVYNGRGALHQRGVTLYDGDWKDGRYEGFGELYHNGKLQYEGNFSQGKYDGHGAVYENGNMLYEGDFKFSMYEGRGVQYDAEGHFPTYEGEFLAGKRHGQGLILMADGGVLYEGQLAYGEFEGEGRAYDPVNGELYYVGGYMSGFPHGTGRLINSETGMTLYEGGYNRGLYEGEGRSFDYATGRLIYEGGFLQGLYHGAGKQYDLLTGAMIYEGDYALGMRIVGAALTDENGKVVYDGPLTEDGSPNFASFAGAPLADADTAFALPRDAEDTEAFTVITYPQDGFQVSMSVEKGSELADAKITTVWFWGKGGIGPVAPGMKNADIFVLLGDATVGVPHEVDGELLAMLKLAAESGNAAAKDALALLDEGKSPLLFGYEGEYKGTAVTIWGDTMGNVLLVSAGA